MQYLERLKNIFALKGHYKPASSIAVFAYVGIYNSLQSPIKIIGIPD